jgi:hypothetical protein
MINRRQFLEILSVAAVAGPLGARAENAQSRKAPFRVLYSNDTTHILSCRPPGPERDKPFTDADLRTSITEAAGADAHFLQPGLGWIPWWKSETYSAADHYAWLREKHGVRGVDKVGRYLLDGGDMLTTLVETCRETGVEPFLSFRLNDGHHTRDLAMALERGKPTNGMSRHYWENYHHYRIGADVNNWDEAVFDWAIPEVRAHKLVLLEEACAQYDLAGVELDFLRHWNRFGSATSAAARRDITTGFVAQVREMLDRAATVRGLPRRWLCIRVPARAEVRPEQGIDLAALCRAGVDMVNLSYSYFTWQDQSVRRAREEAGDAASLYVEMTHTTLTGRATAGSGTQPFLRTTDAQFYTTARMADDQGADGVSLFNFPYYRYHVTETIGPFHEPPFHVLPRLKDRRFLDRQPQWAFLSAGRNDAVLGTKPLPAVLQPDQTQTFFLGMSAKGSGHAGGILRLRSDEPIADREVEVRFNGVPLAPAAPVVQPLPGPYAETWLGKPEELACFTLAPSLPIHGANQVEIVVKCGKRMRLIYLDAVVPSA